MTPEQLALMTEEAKYDPSLADYLAKMTTINGQDYYIPPDQSDPSLFLSEYGQNPGAISTLPDGRFAVRNDLGSQFAQKYSDNGLVGNFLNGPGPVLGLMGGFLGLANPLSAFSSPGLGISNSATATSFANAAYGGAETLGAGLTQAGSSPMFFNDILNIVDPWDAMGDLNAYGLNPGDAGRVFGDSGEFFPNSGSPLTTGAPTMPTSNLYSPGLWDTVKGVGSDLLKGLTGGGNAIPAGLGKGLGSFIRGSLDGAGGDFLGGLLSTAPALAAIAYAKNQDPFDTSRLESAYANVNPDAVTLPYDLETQRGRTNLYSSLADRGVMGSSFGNADITNYDTLRSLGRANLTTGAAGTQAAIADKILQAQILQQKNKNELYGRALLALSGGLSPQKGVADLLFGA